MSSPVHIEACAVGKAYRMGSREVRAVHEVSIQVRQGETLCIMGASGAGKSTLLNMLGGLDRPTTGSVLHEGVDIYRKSSAFRCELLARRVGFVFQSFHLLQELTVIENVMLPAMALRGFLRSSSQVRSRAETLLEQVGLAGRMGHRPLELSGGEQQRAALARALINEPGAVLADEPTGNLDSATGQQVLESLFALTQARGHTLIMVTHNEAISGRCDRTLHMQDGRLLGPASGHNPR